MPRGISIHLGLNSLDPAHYPRLPAALLGCEPDARDMRTIAKARGFETNLLLGAKATRKALTDAVDKAAGKLKAGDILWLSYSGHGGNLPDANDEEPDGLDETWCLFDGHFVDDEVFELLGRLREGVRALLVTDSCHSGTVARAAVFNAAIEARDREPLVFRTLSLAQSAAAYDANRAFYDRILADRSLSGARKKVKASVMLLSACKDDELAADGFGNGLFTGKLKSVWNEGAFAGGYAKFHKAIRKAVTRPKQTPGLFWATRRNAGFLSEEPFSI